jgi:hypothetical protein
MDHFKRTLANLHIGSWWSHLEQTSKDRFDKEMPEWRTLSKAGNWRLEQTKQRKLLLQLDPEMRTSLPKLAAVDVLNRMENAVMTEKQAHSWACEETGLDTGAWSQKMAGSSSLVKRVSGAMRSAKKIIKRQAVRTSRFELLGSRATQQARGGLRPVSGTGGGGGERGGAWTPAAKFT